MNTAVPANVPPVYRAARAVGVLKPTLQMNPQGKVFADKLDVLGTAFWLRDSKVLITCAHVIQHLVVTPIETAGLLVVGNLGTYLRATVGILDFNHDLAVLHLPPDTPSDVMAKELQDGLDIATSYPPVGNAVAYAGFPFGTQLLGSSHAPTYSEGLIASPVRVQPLVKQIQVTGTVAGGFSGAPIVDKSNASQVIAVLANSPSAVAGQASIFMGISWEHVKAIAALSTS